VAKLISLDLSSWTQSCYHWGETLLIIINHLKYCMKKLKKIENSNQPEHIPH
jgi:hypothetical protein